MIVSFLPWKYLYILGLFLYLCAFQAFREILVCLFLVPPNCHILFVLLINNYIIYCCTVLDPWHINSVLICCDPGYIFHGLGSEFAFWCLSLHLDFSSPLTSGLYLQFLSRAYYAVLSKFFLASKLGTKAGSNVCKFILFAGNYWKSWKKCYFTTQIHVLCNFKSLS